MSGPAPAFQIDFSPVGCGTLAFSGTGPKGGEVISGCAFFFPGTYDYSVTGFGGGSGEIVVLPPPLLALDTTVVFGDSVGLAGELPSQAECFGGGGLPTGPPPPPLEKQGTILERPFGDRLFRPLGAVDALGPRGAFALLVTPTIETSYQAQLGALSTVIATVMVRPRLELDRISDGSFVVHASAGHSLAGARVDVQVRHKRMSWHTTTTVSLDADGSARFRAPKSGVSVRVFMPAPEAGPGYIAGRSRVFAL